MVCSRKRRKPFELEKKRDVEAAWTTRQWARPACYLMFVGMAAFCDPLTMELLLLLFPIGNPKEYKATVLKQDRRQKRQNLANQPATQTTSPRQDYHPLNVGTHRVQSPREVTTERREREDAPREVLTTRQSLAENADCDHLGPSASGQQSDSTVVGRKDDRRHRETLAS